MDERYHSALVVFEDGLKDESLEAALNLLRSVRGVESVSVGAANVESHDTLVAIGRVRREVKASLLDLAASLD